MTTKTPCLQGWTPPPPPAPFLLQAPRAVPQPEAKGEKASWCRDWRADPGFAGETPGSTEGPAHVTQGLRTYCLDHTLPSQTSTATPSRADGNRRTRNVSIQSRKQERLVAVDTLKRGESCSRADQGDVGVFHLNQ